MTFTYRQKISTRRSRANERQHQDKNLHSLSLKLHTMLHLVTLLSILLLCSEKCSTITATSTGTNTNNTNEIVGGFPPYITIYKNGTVVRSQQNSFVPPSLNDQETGVSSKDVVISQKPTISARLYLPKLTQHHEHKKVPILVYFHGGGFFYDSAFSKHYHTYLTKLVSQIEVIAISVEYRLAPEHPLPAAYHDSWQALKWVAVHSTKSPAADDRYQWLINHGDFHRVFLGGDSAGATIVHYLSLRAGDEKLPGRVKLLGAIYAHPYFYGSKPIGSEPVNGHEQSLLYVIWEFVYPSAPGGIDNPLINPVVAGAPSLAGLGCSKMIVAVAGNDILRDRGVLYYEAVKKSGWNGELELFEQKGEDHVYHILHPDSESSKKMMKRLASFIMG